MNTSYSPPGTAIAREIFPLDGTSTKWTLSHGYSGFSSFFFSFLPVVRVLRGRERGSGNEQRQEQRQDPTNLHDFFSLLGMKLRS
jgi:hypothetical protein